MGVEHVCFGIERVHSGIEHAYELGAQNVLTVQVAWGVLNGATLSCHIT